MRHPQCDTSSPLYCPPDRLPREGETILSDFVHARSKADYKINPETGCWEWQKFRLRGYAVSGTKKMHRLYWERANGRPVPEGLHVHHTCKTKACVNPAHLEILSQDEHYKHHAYEKSGLNAERIEEIRKAAENPELTYLDMEAMFGCDRQTIMRIIRGKRHGEAVVQAAPRVCPTCGEEFVGRRNKRYCCKDHQKARPRKAAA